MSVGICRNLIQTHIVCLVKEISASATLRSVTFIELHMLSTAHGGPWPLALGPCNRSEGVQCASQWLYGNFIDQTTSHQMTSRHALLS